MKKSLEYKDCPLCFRIVLSKQPYIQFSSHASKLIFDSKAEKISYRHLLNGDGYFCFMNNDSETKEDVYKFTKRGSIITIHSSTLIKKIVDDFDIGEETKIDFVLTENKSKDYDSLLELTVLDIIYDGEFEQLNKNNKEMKEGITTEKIEEENQEQQNEEQKEEQKPDFDISFDIVSCNNGSIIFNNKFPNERYVIEKLGRSTKELLLDSLSKVIEEKIHIEKLTIVDIFDFSINITIKNNAKQ
jgi:hypothetical protein